MILDTQFLGALATQDETARELAAEIDAERTPKRIPSAVVWELFYGLGKIADEEPTQIRQTYETLFRSATVVEMDEDVARRAGTLRGAHEASNRTNLDGADSVVAAHGLLRGEPVVSNDGDFRDVDGLEVVTY